MANYKKGRNRQLIATTIAKQYLTQAEVKSATGLSGHVVSETLSRLVKSGEAHRDESSGCHMSYKYKLLGPDDDLPDLPRRTETFIPRADPHPLSQCWTRAGERADLHGA